MYKSIQLFRWVLKNYAWLCIAFILGGIALQISGVLLPALLFYLAGILLICLHFIRFPMRILQDIYLSRGWFRFQLYLFTEDYFKEGETALPVHWLRVYLPDMQAATAHKKICKANAQFNISVQPYRCTPEKEVLFSLYKNTLAPWHADGYLQYDISSNLFATYAVEVRDGDTLIAVGVYDKGFYSVSTMLTFYHPDYQKNWLGKYVFLKIAEYARKEGKTWLYPGYIIEGNPKMDYKLFYGRDVTEVYVRKTKSWIRFNQFADGKWDAARI